MIEFHIVTETPDQMASVLAILNRGQKTTCQVEEQNASREEPPINNGLCEDQKTPELEQTQNAVEPDEKQNVVEPKENQKAVEPEQTQNTVESDEKQNTVETDEEASVQLQTTEPTDAKPLIDDIRAALAKVSKAHDLMKAKELLKTFGVSRVSDLPEEQYSAFLKAAEGMAL